MMLKVKMSNREQMTRETVFVRFGVDESVMVWSSDTQFTGNVTCSQSIVASYHHHLQVNNHHIP